MASHLNPKVICKVAAADYSTKQYFLVKLSSAGLGVTLSGAGEKAIGSLHNAPASGADAEVYTFGGGGKIKLGGTVSAGQSIKSDANGKGVNAGTDKDYACAIAMEDGVDGDIIDVMFFPHYYAV